MKADGGYNDDTVHEYGPRNKKYGLSEWLRKHPELETDVEVCSEDEPLRVLLPPEEERSCQDTGARPKVGPTQDIILDPLLAYVHSGLQSGTSETTRKAVLGFFPSEVIA